MDNFFNSLHEKQDIEKGFLLKIIDFELEDLFLVHISTNYN